MELQRANQVIENYFSYNTEAYSIAHEHSPNGILLHSDIKELDNKTLIDIAIDLEYQMQIELY